MHSDEVTQSCPLLCVPACECGRLHTSDRMQLNFYLHVSVIQELHVFVDAMIHLHPHTFQGAWLF